jgi:glycosyltransferase involved in cell wall biosynthesis
LLDVRRATSQLVHDEHVKVVHIGDSDSGGGAANAMSRLHGALQRAGVDSHVLVRNSRAPGNGVETIATRGDADDLFPAVREAVIRQYVENNRTSLTNTHFSLHIDGADLSRVPVVASSDIVHLHWTASFQTPADAGALFGAKPVVWTLHDLEPLTGGCHFPAGCEGYVDDCADCPQLVRDPFRITATTLRDKKTLWAGDRPTFVAPSRDIAERARRSAVAQRARASIVHIPHGIDVEVFRPGSKAAARAALGVPVDGLYVLCGSNYNAERRKGLRFLDRVLAAATADSQLGPSKLKLLTVGEPKLDVHDLGGVDVIQLGRVSVDMMPSVYAAADVFLHPSVEDNFPLMLLESLSCGTPAIAFDVGGVPDILQDGVCGRLAGAGDALAMAAALSCLALDGPRRQRMGENARSHVEEHFNGVSIARQHAELYADIAGSRTAPRTRTAPPPSAGIEEIFSRWSAACLVQELALAHEQAAESRAKSERIAALEREAAAFALNLADQSRQVQEKEAELSAIHEVAEERKALVEALHASAASIEALAERLQAEVEVRDDLLAKREATIGEQRAEIELVHDVAAERRVLIAALEGEATGLALNLADQSRQVQEKEAELTAIHGVAEERKALAEKLHASAASIEASTASLQREVRARDDLLATLAATIDEQRIEIELVHRVAAERQLLIEDLHRGSSEHIAAVELEAAALAQSVADQAATLQREVRVRDDLRAKLEATIGEQQAEIELVHGIAAERQLLIDDLQRVAEERLAVIDRLSAVADAPQ